MYVKTAKLVPFALMGERFGIANGKSTVSDTCPRELQPMPLADGK